MINISPYNIKLYDPRKFVLKVFDGFKWKGKISWAISKSLQYVKRKDLTVWKFCKGKNGMKSGTLVYWQNSQTFIFPLFLTKSYWKPGGKAFPYCQKVYLLDGIKGLTSYNPMILLRYHISTAFLELCVFLFIYGEKFDLFSNHLINYSWQQRM